MQKLAKKVAEELQRKKTQDVNFVIGLALTHLASVFHSSFYMANFENVVKLRVLNQKNVKKKKKRWTQDQKD